MHNALLNDLKKEVYILEQLIKANSGGTLQEKHMNLAYDIVLQSLKHLIIKHE